MSSPVSSRIPVRCLSMAWASLLYPPRVKNRHSSPGPCVPTSWLTSGGADGGEALFALCLDQWRFDSQRVLVRDDVNAAVLGVLRHPGLVSDGSEHDGTQLLELLRLDATGEYVQHEIPGVPFDLGCPGLLRIRIVDARVDGGLPRQGVDRIGDSVCVIGFQAHGGRHFRDMSVDLEQGQCGSQLVEGGLGEDSPGAVSYTHLTLPTILRV